MSNELPIRYSLSGEAQILQANERLKSSTTDMFGSYERGSGRVKTAMFEVQGSVRTTNDQLSVMARRTEQAFQLVIAGLIRRGVGELQDYADSYKALTGQIATTADTEADLVRIRNSLFDITQRTRTSIETTGTLYGRLSRATEEYGLSEQKRLKFTELANKSAKIGQTTIQEQNAALIQLSQGIASGQLRGEELRSVMEQTPELARAIAQGLGVSIGALREMAEQGELTADRVIGAVLSMEETINDRFEAVPKKISEGWEALSNALIKYIGEVDEAKGLSESFGGTLIGVADNIDLVVDAATVLGIAMLGIYSGRLFTRMADATRLTLEQASAQRLNAKAALEAAVAQKAATADQLRQQMLSYQITGQGHAALRDTALRAEAAQLRYNQALVAYNQVSSRAAMAGRGLLAAMGGVPGLLATGTLALFSFTDVLGSSEDATDGASDAMKRYLDRVKDTAEAIEDLTDKELKRAGDLGGRDTRILGAKVRKAGAELAEGLDLRGGFNVQDFAGIAAIVRPLREGLEDGTVSADELLDKIATLGTEFKSYQKTLDDLTPLIDNYVELQREAAEATSQLADVQKELATRSDPLDAVLGNVKDADLQSFLSGLPRDPGDAFRRETQSYLDGLKGGKYSDADATKFFEILAKEAEVTAELREQQELLQMRLEGRGDEADILGEILAIEDKIGGRLTLDRDEIRKLLEDRQKITAELKRQQEIEKQQGAFDKKLKNAKAELKALEALRDGNEALSEELRLQYALMEEFPLLTDEQRQELMEIYRLQQNITDEMEAQKRAQADQRELSRFLFEAWDDEGARFWDMFKDTGKKTITDMLSLLATGGSLGDLFNPENSQLGQLLAGKDGTGGILRALGFDGADGLAGDLLGLFGGTSAGMQVGQLLGASGTASAVGSALGSLAGKLLGDPTGGLLGGIVGGAISSLFGGAADKAGTTLRTDGAGNVYNARSRDRGDGDVAVSNQLASSVGDSLASLASQLGASITGGMLLGEIGYRKDEYFFDPSANASEKNLGEPKNDSDTLRFKTAEEAAQAALVHALRSGALTGLPDEVMARLKSVTASTLDQVLSDVQVFMGLSGVIEAGLAEVTDPLEAALRSLRAEYEEAVAAYQRMGADIKDANDYYLKQQEDFIASYRAAGTALLTDFLTQLTTGQYSGLTDVERLKDTRESFLDLRSDVLAGTDVDDQALVAAANAFLEASLAVNAFTGAFFEDRSLVEATVGREIDNFNAGVEETLSTADLIQPLDTIAALTEGTNDLLADLTGLVTTLPGEIARSLASFGYGGGAVGGGARNPGFRAFAQ